MTKNFARCFGQDIMRGEHTIGGGVKTKQHVDGVLMKSDSGNDPSYYFKKQQVEKKLGRSITTEEFQLKYYEGPDTYESGTSIFDPVLCELAYRWFCPPGGLVLDPFAGGSVRGIVAAKLGRKYVGIDLSARQIEANMEQAARICGNNKPLWHIGDSREIDALCPDVQADFIFSCPPYADLEVYSDNPQDLSTMPYPVFLKAYQEIIKKSCALLKENRFACFVIGEVRDSKGHYYQFVPDTIKSFTACGLKYYNEAILVTAVGSLPIRVGRQFEAGRKLGKTHQNVLVFIKGDAKKGTADIGPVEFGDISSEVLNAENP